jgi:ethanolamine utilization protein EutN
MRIAEIIGKVTLAKSHPLLTGGTFVVAVPLSRDGLNDRTKGRDEALVVFDELGAGAGSLIAISEGAEAAAPFHPETKPIDAYNAAILDTVNVQ